MSTPNPPADGSGQDDAGQQPAPEQAPWSQPPGAPPVAPPIAPPVAPPAYGQQPPPGPYGQQPPADPYGQQQPWAPNAGYPANPANPYGGTLLPKEAYASWGQRVGAYLLDYLLVLPFAIVGFILIVVGAASTASSTTYNSSTGTYNTSGGFSLLAVLGYLIYMFGAIGVTAWNRWYKGGKTGQSWGKRVMGLKVVREADGQPLGAGVAFVRDLAHVVDGLICYVGYLFPLWDVKRQTLADKIISSVVYPGVPKSNKLL